MSLLSIVMESYRHRRHLSFLSLLLAAAFCQQQLLPLSSGRLISAADLNYVYTAAFCQCQQQLLPLSSGQLISSVDLNYAAGNATDGSTSVYIVHVRRPEPHELSAGSPEELEAWHRSFLPTSPLLDSGEPRMVFSYTTAISGFAARLTPEEAEAMRETEGVLGVHPDEPLVFQTTYTPDFMGLRDRRTGKWLAPNQGDGIIIGVVDSGINPDHVSFSDAGMPAPPPGKWKGLCEFTGRPTCNNKLLGARNYDADSKTTQPKPYDTVGHGTHVAGTAAGAAYAGASIRGLAQGTGTGSAPKAYLAVYKAKKLSEALAAVNQAISDGVDLISMSLFATKSGRPFYDDDLAIAALSAVERGILVSACAANFGPAVSTMRNDAPWMMTVGATTTNRLLRATLTLGTGKDVAVVVGESLHTGTPLTYGLVYPGKDGDPDAQACRTLAGPAVAKKAVLCHTDMGMKVTDQSEVIRKAGGAAMVFMNSQQRADTISNIPDVAITAIAIDFCGSSKVVDYIRKAPNPTGTISTSTTVFDGAHPFPAVPSFSSRGPSTVNGGVLKPDILGPGVNILAADSSDKKGFKLLSGTSMATPFLSGVAAILKRSQATWTPARIKSALMTTADSRDRRGDNIADETGFAANLHAVGSGQVNPSQAINPGLVYDLDHNDYLRYLCGLGYTDAQVTMVNSGRAVRCATVGRTLPEDLNCPSIWVTLKLPPKGGAPATKTVTRKLTSLETGTYRLMLELLPPNSAHVEVTVAPRDQLVFATVGQTREYKVTFTVRDGARLGVVRGRLKWVSSPTREVATPLLLTIA